MMRWVSLRWGLGLNPVGLAMGLAFAFGLSCPPLVAQLISPGKLSEAHADWEGIRSCTNCHALRQRGASPDLCLSCHVPLSTRLTADLGFHASIEESDCGACHKEHFGRDFDVRHLDQATFEHDLTGFELEGSHVGEDCRKCHTSDYVIDSGVAEFKGRYGTLDRTFLGLDSQCLTCHQADDPHGTQFVDRSCSGCHDAGAWEEAGAFDHEATAYTLAGQHLNVECGACHEEVAGVLRYSPLEYGECGVCHDDPHETLLGSGCTTCHSESGWHRVRRSVVDRNFDHGVTGFPLRGAHVSAACGTCHAPTPLRDADFRITYLRGTASFSYPHPRSTACASCHVDAHEGELMEGPSDGDCDSCHGEESWTPANFGLQRHTDDVDFPLTGAHLVTPCSACHLPERLAPDRLTFRFADSECLSCHAVDDPHEGEYGDSACSVCHTTEEFQMESFDHETAAAAAITRDCISCHAEDDPHADQFEDQQCSQCHVTKEFAVEDFDHGNTRFEMDGAHETVECTGCHTPALDTRGLEFVRYRGVDPECTACHQGETV